MATVFRPPLTTRIQRREPSRDLLSWMQGTPETLLPALLPFSQKDWPAPKGKTFSRSILNPLGGRTIIPEPPPFALLDWPVPKGKPYPADLRTWLQEVQFFPQQPPFAQLDWPVPKAKSSSISLRTQFGRIILPEQAPFSLTDWPVPKGRLFPIELRLWLQNLQQSTFSLPQTPFATRDWPVPKGRIPGISLRTWVGRIITEEAPPPVLQEQILPPRGARRSTALLTWTGRIVIPEAVPFRDVIWQVPRGKPFPEELRSWLVGLIAEPGLVLPPTPTPIIPPAGGDSRRVGLRKRPLYYWEAAALKRLSRREVEDSLVEELAYAEATIPKSLDDFEERVSHLREIAKRLDSIRIYHELAKRVRSVIERFEETRIKQLADQDEENEINDLIQFL